MPTGGPDIRPDSIHRLDIDLLPRDALTFAIMRPIRLFGPRMPTVPLALPFAPSCVLSLPLSLLRRRGRAAGADAVFAPAWAAMG